MRATPLTYEHEPRRVFFWVVRDLRPDPRYILGIEVASRAQLPRCAPTGGPSYVPTAQRSVWERILASPARVCMYLKANNFVGKCNGRLPGRPAAIERAVLGLNCVHINLTKTCGDWPHHRFNAFRNFALISERRSASN